jgi:hypothetical protein
MSRIASYFSAGYLPSLITTYYNQLDLADLLATSDNATVQAFVRDERDRFDEDGFAEATEMRIAQLVGLSSQMGFVPPARPAARAEIFGWLNDMSEGVRGKLNAGTPAHQTFLMIHAAGNNAGEIACSINLLIWVLRYLLIADVPELVVQWEATVAALPGQVTRLQNTYAFDGLPETLQQIAEPLLQMAGELGTFPIRSDDKPYIVLLGRYMQHEYFNLLDTLEFAADSLSGKLPTTV